MSEAPSTAPLVSLLHEASELEHCLLDTYLYAACSLKTHPEELAVLSDGRDNRRRAIQFERIRAWKQAILNVAQEEMLHLHYVQCLIRALGETPYFGLPERDPGSGGWLFVGWRMRIGGKEPESGTEVPVEPLTPATARRFVLYESTDALQEADPFGPASMELFERLHDFEVDFLFESLLLDVADDAEREALKAKLAALYAELTPAEALAAAEALVPEAIDVGAIQFQSIADLYNGEILPRYKEAFSAGLVRHANVDLNAELQNPDFAKEGFLPVGPVYRDKNFAKRADENVKDPLRHYRDVEDVVAEIVEEGEGLQGFQEGAEAMLAKVAALGGSRAYLQALLADKASKSPTPDWLEQAQRVRLSHLYRFAMTMVELDRERDLARQAGVDFEPARTPLEAGAHDAIGQLAATAPAQFNSCYLALLAWLARIYEIRTWDSDRRRRMGIEMLASWPMMSIAIRPFLELMSFLPVDRTRLFRLESEALPDTPDDARRLLELYDAPERSQAVHDRMDRHALHALSATAKWAAQQRDGLAKLELDPVAKQIMTSCLDSLSGLDEFERQFPFREHGGYSDRQPDIEYMRAHPDFDRYEEAPQKSLFNDTLVLRVRFAGRGLVQLATDPDPPTDEAGCSGTHMLHAADGDRRFDRSLIWRPAGSDDAIVREPREQLPALGVKVLELALMVTDGTASAGYVPISVMQSTGAVETSGVQQRLDVTGLNPLAALAPGDLHGQRARLAVELLARDGRTPYLNGYNHLVWQDGEPIDPFVLAVLHEPAGGDAQQPLLQREVFNEGRFLMQMSPLQRLFSSRGVCGFDSVENIPPWAHASLSDEQRRLLADPTFPSSYLDARAATLAQALRESLDAASWTRDAVDQTVSFAERLRLVAVPRSTTVGWLGILCHYGHTVSGELAPAPEEDPLLAELGQRIGAEVAVATAARGEPNGRWLASYTKGVMDTDALSYLVYGELYAPLTARPGGKPLRFSRKWRFVAGMEDLLAAYACRFGAPFWGDYKVAGNTRTTTLPDGTTIEETLTEQGPRSYYYTAAGVPGVGEYKAGFVVTTEPDAAVLTWSARFTAGDGQSLVRMLGLDGAAAAAMEDALAEHFAPA